MLYIASMLLLLALSPLAAAWHAMRAEYLVVLHWDRIGYVVLERGPGGRYDLIRPTLAPRAVARHTRQALAEGVQDVRRRARSWAHAHMPHVLSAKI